MRGLGFGSGKSPHAAMGKDVCCRVSRACSGVLYSAPCLHHSVVLLPGGVLRLICPTANMHPSYLSLANSGPLAALHPQTDIMVRPPKQGEPSYELYCKERDGIIGVLQHCAFVYTAHWPRDCQWRLMSTPPLTRLRIAFHLNVRYRDIF
jgi:hypothetical protein